MGSKNSGGGPKWVVRQERLSEALQFEQQIKETLCKLLEEDGNQEAISQYEEVTGAIKTWFRMYHSVVLLVAAMQPPAIHPVNTAEQGFVDCPSVVVGRFCLKNSYMLPAFGLEEEDSSSLSGLRFERMIDNFKHLYQSGALGKRFIRENNSAQPIVEYLLGQYQPVPLANFAQTRQEIIGGCHSSVSNLVTAHPQTESLVGRALGLVEDLWSEEIENQLAEVNNWKVNGLAGSEQLWNETIGIDDNLKNRILGLFPNGNRDIQLQVGQVAAASHLIGDILIFVENRFLYADDIDISHGFEGVIAKYSQLDQQAWSQLLSITWGAVAWQAVNQARTAVRTVTDLL